MLKLYTSQLFNKKKNPYVKQGQRGNKKFKKVSKEQHKNNEMR